MQYALKVFEAEDHSEFRTVDRDGEPWFVLVDVCRALDIRNPSDAAARLDEDEKMSLVLTEDQSGVRGGARSMTIINESGLYSVILRSDKPGAKRFKKWVTSEVLPSIRKTGSFGKRNAIPLFLRRYSENHGRVAEGHFSVIQVLATHLYGPLEFAGHLLAERGPDGKEMRPENSVGRMFSDWLKENHPDVSDNYSYYVHWTPQAEFPARQYPNSMYALFVEYLQAVWIPQSPAYFKKRDPAALPHLQQLLPSPEAPRAGMMRQPTLRKIARRV